jgi:hypothetical protein
LREHNKLVRGAEIQERFVDRIKLDDLFAKVFDQQIVDLLGILAVKGVIA